MSNSFYNHGAFPSTGSAATSASMRAELDLVAAGFDKMPTLAGNANKFIVVNSTGTGLTQTDVLPAFTVTDTDFTVQDDGDNTRKFQFNAGSITTGNTRVYVMPDLDTTLVGTNVTQTLTNKTLTAPVIATIVNTGTLTLPTSTDTLVGRNTTDTLTNKTLTNPVIGTIVNTGTLTLPTSTDTLVGRQTTDTLTNKTISGASNTLSNIANGSLSNSSVVIGSTTLSLGGTMTTLAGVTISGASNTLSNIANASLTNSSITINGSTVALGSSVTVTATATNALTIGNGLSGTSYNGSAAVTIAINTGVTADLSTAQTFSNKTISGSANTLTNIANASLTNSAITIGSTAISLGATSLTLAGLTSASATTLISTGNQATSVAISAIGHSSGTVTVTTGTAHGLTTGDTASIDGVADYTFCGVYTVTVTNANVFTYSQTASGASSSGGFSTKLSGTWGLYAGGTGPSLANGPVMINASSQMPALRVTQGGSGYALIVEDAANPDTSAFIISNAGDLTINTNKFTVAAASGNTVIAGTTSLNGNVTFATDATYDIGASGATRPRDLFLSRNLVVGGTLTLAGGVNLNGNVTIGDASTDTLTITSTITSNLIFTDNTYDIGASGATRPRNLYLAGSATIGSGMNVTGSALVTLAATTGSLSVRGAASGSANFILQDNAGTGVAWWLSAKTSGLLAIGGNGGSEPALGAINIGSTGNVSVGATAGSGLFQVGTPGSATGSLRAFSSLVSIDANYQSTNVIGTASAPALIFGGDDNTGIWHPASDVIAISNAGGETARFDASKNFVIGATATNGKLTVYNGTVGGTATTLTPTATLWMDYAAALGDNTGSGPSFVLSTGNTPSGLGKTAAIGAPSEDSGGLHRVVGLSFWTSAFDANRAEVGRFTGIGGNFLVGNTTAYAVGETQTIQVKGEYIWAANNTASANNRNWRIAANATVNGALEFWNSGNNTAYPNNAAVMSMLQSAVTFPRSDVVISNATGATTNFFRAYEVGAGGNNAGFSMGISGAKGSIYGASGLQGMRIVGGNNTLFFGGFSGDTSVYANYNSFGVWTNSGLVVGDTSSSSGDVITGAGTSNYGLASNRLNSLNANDNAGFIRFRGGNGSNSAAAVEYAGIYSVATSTVAGAEAGDMLFYTRNAGNTAEKVRIRSTGQTLFGLGGGAAPATASSLIYANGSSASYGIIGARNGSGRNTFSVIGDNNFDCGYIGTSDANSTSALLEASGANGVRFAVSGSERGRFAGNNFMVGTTSTDGGIGNDIGSITGRTKTASGGIVMAAAGWYTAFTIDNPGLYILHAYIGGYNAGPADWSNGWFITYTGGNNAFISSSVFGATGNIQARISNPRTVEIYLQAGTGITFTWVVQRIG